MPAFGATAPPTKEVGRTVNHTGWDGNNGPQETASREIGKMGKKMEGVYTTTRTDDGMTVISSKMSIAATANLHVRMDTGTTEIGIKA